MKKTMMVIFVFALGIVFPISNAVTDEPNGTNAEAVFALLDVIDAIVEQNQDYRKTQGDLLEMDDEDRRRALDRLQQINVKNPMIADRIDAFLNTNTMQMYFKRFQNVTPEHYRNAFLALPYEKYSAPGDIAVPLLELLEDGPEIRNWLAGVVDRIDLTNCRNRAQEWLPEGDYAIPELYLVYDNNSGSFAAFGKSFYNVYSDIVSKLPENQKPQDITGSDMEEIIAHEFHHVMAGPYYMFSRRQNDRWERDFMDRIIREIVSEGAANHCNPPSGFKQVLWEDRQTISMLIGELNRRFTGLEAGKVSEPEIRKWYGETYFELPKKLLEEFVVREYDQSDVDETVRTYMSVRPDLVHTLGWWMVSAISKKGADPGAVKSLVKKPYALFARYNESVSGDDLRVDPQIARLANR